MENQDIIRKVIEGLLWALVGGVLGYYSNEHLKKIHTRIKKKQLKRKLENTSRKFQSQADIFVIESGDPFLLYKDIIITDSERQLVIGIPSQYAKQLKENDTDFEFREQVSFDGSSSFDDLVRITGIENLIELIAKHSIKVAENFLDIQRRNLLLFNGGTVGLYKIGRQRIGENEKSKLKIMTYRSDFFTSRVFASIYQELRSQGHKISKIDKLEQFTGLENNYSPFLAGVAATTFVVLYEGLSIVLAERSEYITSEQRKWHYSMDEGFTQTDYEEGKPSFIKCFWRGLKEELNVDDAHSLSEPPKFMDLVFHRNVFELEFTSLFYYPKSFEDFKANYNRAKDRHLETYGLYELPLNAESINRFIQEHEVMDGCKLSLQLLAQRHTNDELDSFQ